MTTTNENAEKTLFGVFTSDEVKKLHDEYQLHHNLDISLLEIAKPLFRKYNVRAWEDAGQEVRNKIKTAFLSLQAEIVTKFGVKKETIKHRKGDVMRLINGEPVPKIINPDGTPKAGPDDTVEYVTYVRDFLEEKKTYGEIPYFNYVDSLSALKDIERRLRAIRINDDI